MQSVFYNEKFKSLEKHSPLTILASLYTLRVSTLIGSHFDTPLLKESGLCPQIFVSPNEKVALTKVLDILEEHDFIECIDQVQDERCYRFNHNFLAASLSQTVPFATFRIHIHKALVEHYKKLQPCDKLPSSEIVRLLTKQSLLWQRTVLR